MTLDLSMIDTQKTMETVIELKQPIKESLSQLINILDKFDCKSKLSELEKNICDYIDDHKKAKEIREELIKPKINKYALLVIILRGGYTKAANNCINKRCKCHEYIKNRAISGFLKVNIDFKLVNESKTTVDKLCNECSSLDMETKIYICDSPNKREEIKSAARDIESFGNYTFHTARRGNMLFDIDLIE